MEQKPSFFKKNKTFWHNPIAVILGANILFFTSQLVGVSFVQLFLPYESLNKNIQLLLLVGASTAVLFALLSVGLRLFGSSWRAIGFTLPKPKYVFIVPLAFVAYLSVSLIFTFIAQQIIPGFDLEQAQDIGFTTTNAIPELIAAFFSLVVLTPLLEEIIFRGVLFKGLRKRVPFWLAAVVTSIIFAIAHGQWNVAVDTFALSLMLCFLVEKSGSIVPAILLHALKNGLAFTLIFLVKIT